MTRENRVLVTSVAAIPSVRPIYNLSTTAVMVRLECNYDTGFVLAIENFPL